MTVLQLNEIVRKTVEMGIVHSKVFLGTAKSRPYADTGGILDSGQVVQAALLIPEGFGVCRFDAEEYIALEQQIDGVVAEARVRFVPFHNCSHAEKAFLNLEIRGLFERFNEYTRQNQLP